MRGHDRKWDDSYRLSKPERSDQLRLCDEFQSAGWQCHRHGLIDRPLVAKRLEIYSWHQRARRSVSHEPARYPGSRGF
jgi:hypothetical protein